MSEHSIEDSLLYRKTQTSQKPQTSQKLQTDDKIRQYIQKNRPSIVLLTPCYGGTCLVSYVHSLIQTVDIMRKYEVPFSIEFCKNDSLVSRARNNLIAKAMSNTSSTHIMFIDSDITWNPMDVLKLMADDKPIIGGIYPLKHYNWNKLLINPVSSMLTKKRGGELNHIISDEEYIRHQLVNYNLNLLGPKLTIENNVTQVKHLATGFMMIQRHVLETMYKAFPSTKYRDDVGFLTEAENEYAYALFDCGVEEGHYLSEDWLFCNRWKNMGGDIWADISIRLNHTGLEEYTGFLLSTLL